MDFIVRPGTLQDAEECGTICFNAFADIMSRHGLPQLLTTPEEIKKTFARRLSRPGYHAIVAEQNGRLLGSIFIDERSLIAGVGPLTVDPAVQDSSVGRRIMKAVLQRERERRCAGMRLCQDAYHNRSLALYAKVGFETREPLVVLQGQPLKMEFPGHAVRRAGIEDIHLCNALCRRVFGYERDNQLMEAIEAGTAVLVEWDNRCTGYATQIGYSGHAIGETHADLKALIGAAPQFAGPGFILPIKNVELFRWCLEQGLQIVKVMLLMSVGLYHDPQGAWLPSISG